MPCKSCGSVNQSKFTAEMGIHFPGLENIDKPVVWVFPELVICLDCGNAEFAVPEAELRLLVKGDAADRRVEARHPFCRNYPGSTETQ